MDQRCRGNGNVKPNKISSDRPKIAKTIQEKKGILNSFNEEPILSVRNMTI